MNKWQIRGMSRVSRSWQTSTDLGVSYQVLDSLGEMRLVEKRNVTTAFPEAQVRITQWRKK